MDQSLDRLSGLYESIGWKDFENWIQVRIDDCIRTVMDPDTPMEEADRIRVVAFTFQSILDKVEGDKQVIQQNDEHKG